MEKTKFFQQITRDSARISCMNWPPTGTNIRTDTLLQRTVLAEHTAISMGTGHNSYAFTALSLIRTS